MELLSENKAVWCGIINHRYNNLALKFLVADVSVVNKQDLIWWRDLLISNNYANLGENHYAWAVSCNVGDGESVSFWYLCWAGDQLLRGAYPELFMLALDHLISVEEVGSATDLGWQWIFEAFFRQAQYRPTFWFSSWWMLNTHSTGRSLQMESL